ncbi:hypothetical protein IWW40_000896 [Coemansia sp. RSA 1250]|nr:hypothetical protein IWW40_000896 [Coemansia sp. RSA 1250]
MSIQRSSISKLDSAKHNELGSIVAKFEECVEQMYQALNTSNDIDKELKSTIDSFERELQLKQHISILLGSSDLPSSQTDLITALWKTQPYVHSIINKD